VEFRAAVLLPDSLAKTYRELRLKAQGLRRSMLELSHGVASANRIRNPFWQQSQKAVMARRYAPMVAIAKLRYATLLPKTDRLEFNSIANAFIVRLVFTF
jgi:hypothetical protein